MSLIVACAAVANLLSEPEQTTLVRREEDSIRWGWRSVIAFVFNTATLGTVGGVSDNLTCLDYTSILREVISASLVSCEAIGS